MHGSQLYAYYLSIHLSIHFILSKPINKMKTYVKKKIM